MALEIKIASPTADGFVQEIVWNADEIATEVEAKIGYYKNLVYTEDQVVDAKKDRANLNKFIKALKDKDKEIKDLCLAPYEEFHNQMLKIISLVEEPAALIDKQVKDYEESQRKEKLALIHDIFAAKGFQPWVTLERIMNPKWLNKSFSKKQIDAEMTSIQHRIGGDILTINSLPEGSQAALSDYKRTMDINSAITAANRFTEAKRAEENLKKTLPLEDEAPFGTNVTNVTPVAPVTPHPEVVANEKREKAFKVFVTREQLMALNQCFKENGIIFRELKKGEYK